MSMNVYVLYFRDTYVDIDGSEEPDDVVGVFSSVEKIAEFMKQEDGWHCLFRRQGEEWIRTSQHDYPHDEIFYYKEFTLNEVEP